MRPRREDGSAGLKAELAGRMLSVMAVFACTGRWPESSRLVDYTPVKKT
jgi:hypothetical protein